MTDRTPRTLASRPLVIVAAFAGSLVVGLVLMLWAVGGLRNVAAPAAIGGPFQLTDQAGQTVTEKNLKGRPTLIFFGFTHCPDVCPTALFEISEVLRAMGKDADRVNAYFVSVDPERDTAAAMKDYLSSFDPHLKGLTGESRGGGEGDFRLPGLCPKVPLKDRRLHHGSHRADLSDGPRRQVRRAVQSEADARGGRGRPEAVSLSPARRDAINGVRVASRMVYKAVEIRKNRRQCSRRSSRLRRKIASNRPRHPGDRPALAAGCGAVRRPGTGANPAQARRGGRPAGGARLLGPAAASGPARSVAPHGDPVPDRNRLSAVQLHRPRRQSGRLQCRSGAGCCAKRSRSPARSRCGASRRCSMRSPATAATPSSPRWR